jgi:hypothetical protein
MRRQEDFIMLAHLKKASHLPILWLLQALAVAAEALKLASLVDPRADPGTWDLVQQIGDAAKLVSVMAGDLANPGEADTTLEQLLGAQGQELPEKH